MDRRSISSSFFLSLVFAVLIEARTIIQFVGFFNLSAGSDRFFSSFLFAVLLCVLVRKVRFGSTDFLLVECCMIDWFVSLIINRVIWWRKRVGCTILTDISDASTFVMGALSSKSRDSSHRSLEYVSRTTPSTSRYSAYAESHEKPKATERLKMKYSRIGDDYNSVEQANTFFFIHLNWSEAFLFFHDSSQIACAWRFS